MANVGVACLFVLSVLSPSKFLKILIGRGGGEFLGDFCLHLFHYF